VRALLAREDDMDDNKREETRPQSDADRQSDYIRGGKGRKDEVGGSGIYPASSDHIPADAEIRSEAGLVGHKGPQHETTEDEEEG
jgi:hypothetical protein